jgi:hypothetical protein
MFCPTVKGTHGILAGANSTTVTYNVIQAFLGRFNFSGKVPLPFGQNFI